MCKKKDKPFIEKWTKDKNGQFNKNEMQINNTHIFKYTAQVVIKEMQSSRDLEHIVAEHVGNVQS